jgi:hypothetical protein
LSGLSGLCGCSAKKPYFTTKISFFEKPPFSTAKKFFRAEQLVGTVYALKEQKNLKNLKTFFFQSCRQKIVTFEY